MLYGCDRVWWEVHRGCPEFAGEKWSSHSEGTNNKLTVAEKYGLELVQGKGFDGFSLDPAVIHYGGNSGFQAINLAILLGARPVVLVGFDMQGSHFFGAHEAPLRNADPRRFIPAFERAAKLMPAHIEIINATPGSALTCFKRMTLDEALSDRS